MQPTQRRVPSPAIILALVALTFALAGTALAGPNVSKITKSKVRTIADKEVEKLAPDLSVAKADKATTADTATTATGVAAAVVGTAELKQIISVQATSAAVPNASIASAFIQCPAGTRVIDGGGVGSGPFMYTTLTRMSGENGWRYDAFNANAAPSSVTVFARCLQ
jgi:hypothetical protein